MLFSQNKATDLHFNFSFVVTDSLIYTDTLTIIQPSFILKDKSGEIKNDSLYYFRNNKVFLTSHAVRLLKGDTLSAEGRTLLVNLGKQYFHLDSNALKNTERAVYIGYDMGKNSRIKGESITQFP